MEENEFRYDAFISYRHLPLDKAVAVRLQELLETYHPPKGSGAGSIRRVFRDQSELPTSGDLGADIREALQQARYLIVICSSQTKDSAWCMEEIRQFRQLHQGRNDHILVVLAEGDPREVFPEELRYESILLPQPDGSVRQERRELEPLSADVRAGSVRQSLRLLKTEFLRVAAPILGCGFDDLYRRHERRRKRRLAAAAGSTAAVFTAVLAVIAVFAWRTWISEQNYQSILADSYTRQGIESAEDGDLQDALLYYASALSLEPEEQTAAAMGAVLLLEQNTWLYAEQELTGRILGGTVYEGVTALNLTSALAVSADGSVWLESGPDGYEAAGSDGSLQQLGEEMGEFLDASADGTVWVFCTDEELLFYETKTGEITSLARPTQINPECGDEEWDLGGLPAALPAADGKMMVVYGGYVYLYGRSESGQEDWQLEAEADLAEVFPSDVGDLDQEGYLWVSEDGTLAVVASGFGIAAFDTDDLTLRGTCLDYHYLLNEVAFSADGEYYALVFGNTFGQAYTNQGGYLAVYSRDGELILKTQEDPETPYQGAVFDPEDPQRLLAWTYSSLELWDLEEQALLAVPVEEDWIDGAAFDLYGRCTSDDGDGNLTVYGLVSFSAAGETGGETDAGTDPSPSGTESAGEESLFSSEDGETGSDGGEKDAGEESLFSSEDGETGSDDEDSGNADADSAEELQEIEIEGMSEAVRLSDGAVLARTASRVYLLDGDGAALDELRLEEAVSGMLVLPGADAAYLYRENSTVLYMVSLNGDRTAFGDVLTLNTRGRTVRELWRLDGRMVLVTGSNELLIYVCGESEPEQILALEHSGEVQEVQELSNGCLAVSLRYNLSSTDTYHINTEETVELWDPETGLHIADLEPEEAALADQELPVPDEEAIAFLLSLSGSAFDDAQNLTVQTPTLSAGALGTWAELLVPETESFGPEEEAAGGTAAADSAGEGAAGGEEGAGSDEGAAGSDEDAAGGDEDAADEDAAAQDLSDLVTAYQDGPADGEEDAWFEDCDRVWEALRDGDIAFTGSSLNSWIRLILSEAEEHECLDRLQTGVECYLAIHIEYAADDSLLYSWYDYYLMSLMSETELYDGTIAAGFGAIADVLEASLEGMDLNGLDWLNELYALDELDAYTRQYELLWLRCYQGLLSGEGEESFRDLDLMDSYTATELYTLELLWQGEAQDAAEQMSNYLQYALNAGMDSESLLEAQQVMQLNYYVLAKREVVSTECLSEYLELLPTDAGVLIEELAIEGQQMGLKLGDLILAADEVYLSCLQQAEDVLVSSDPITLKVLRDGQVLYLEQTGAGYGGSFEITFRDSLTE